MHDLFLYRITLCGSSVVLISANEFYPLSNVSGVGGSLMRAKPRYVQTYPVALPPLSEQQRLVARIESLFAKLDAKGTGRPRRP